MPASIRKVLVTSALGVGVGTACLGTLPDPLACPPATVYGFCRTLEPVSTVPSPSVTPAPAPVPGGPAPPVPSVPSAPTRCPLDTSCLAQQGRSCACSGTGECKGRGDPNTCSPAPDCPRSVRAVETGATCVQATGSIVASTTVPDCTCGCASCATTCDGQGPVVGPDQTLRFELPNNLPSSGRLGVMVRSRGTGPATLSLEVGREGRGFGIVAAEGEFREVVVTSADTAYSWTSDGTRPTAIELRTAPASVIEVDCVVPFVVR